MIRSSTPLASRASAKIRSRRSAVPGNSPWAARRLPPGDVGRALAVQRREHEQCFSSDKRVGGGNLPPPFCAEMRSQPGPIEPSSGDIRFGDERQTRSTESAAASCVHPPLDRAPIDQPHSTILRSADRWFGSTPRPAWTWATSNWNAKGSRMGCRTAAARPVIPATTRSSRRPWPPSLRWPASPSLAAATGA